MSDADVEAAEQLERELGRLTVTFGHLEDELLLALDCLLDGDGFDASPTTPQAW